MKPKAVIPVSSSFIESLVSRKEQIEKGYKEIVENLIQNLQKLLEIVLEIGGFIVFYAIRLNMLIKWECMGE